jgi:excisionase family DNA binding protein
MNTAPQLQPYYYTPTQIAAILQVQRRTVYAWIKDDKLAAVRAGNRVRVNQQALDDFLRSTK